MENKIVYLLFLSALCILCTEAESEKYEKLVKSSRTKQSPVVEFTQESITRYATSPRDFSLFVLISTDSPQVNCESCPYVDGEYKKVASLYKKTLGSDVYNSTKFARNPIFFGRCEVVKCLDFFKEGEYQGFPTLLFFSRSKNTYEKVPYNEIKQISSIYEDPSEAGIASAVAEMTGYRLDVPQDQYMIYATYGASALGLLILLWAGASVANQVFKNPMFWFALSLGVFAFVMAGTVFNSINRPPFAYRHPSTQQLYLIYPANRQQFVVEGMIMAALFIVGSLSIIGFTKLVPEQREPVKQRLLFGACTMGFYICFFWTMKIYKLKNPYYPLW